MKLPRRNFLHLAANAAALPAVSQFARAQAYPSAGAHRRPICRRRSDRHHRSSDRPMAVGVSRPAICHREPAGSRQQYWHGGGRECAAGRSITRCATPGAACAPPTDADAELENLGTIASCRAFSARGRYSLRLGSKPQLARPGEEVLAVGSEGNISV